MTPDELLRKEAAKWLREAAKDRNAAHILLEAEPSLSVFFRDEPFGGTFAQAVGEVVDRVQGDWRILVFQKNTDWAVAFLQGTQGPA